MCLSGRGWHKEEGVEDYGVRDKGTRIFLERIDRDVPFRALDGSKASSDDPTSSSAYDVENAETRINDGLRM